MEMKERLEIKTLEFELEVAKRESDLIELRGKLLKGQRFSALAQAWLFVALSALVIVVLIKQI